MVRGGFFVEETGHLRDDPPPLLLNDATLWWPRIAIAKKLLLLTNIVNINTKIKIIYQKNISLFFCNKIKNKKREKKRSVRGVGPLTKGPVNVQTFYERTNVGGA